MVLGQNGILSQNCKAGLDSDVVGVLGQNAIMSQAAWYDDQGDRGLWKVFTLPTFGVDYAVFKPGLFLLN